MICVRDSLETPQLPASLVRRPQVAVRPVRVADRPDAAFARFAPRRSLFYRVPKRAIDIVGAACLIVFLSPVMLGTLAILLFTTKGKPLYRQRRLGLLGRPFWMVKFRTMVPDAERYRDLVENEVNGPVFKNRRDPRITRFGKILRKFSIDETPQLFNVLAGTMSLVGPRSPIPGEVDLYEPWQCERLSVKPGLTCIWQVEGRCDVPFLDWVRMDIRYARSRRLATDLAILLKTPWAVITGKGAY
jgi:lipopolysaccharide/colanic/teichoic acid biosynthesis glycosyltransferase